MARSERAALDSNVGAQPVADESSSTSEGRDQFFAAVRPKLVAAIDRTCRNRELADDIAQEAIAGVLRRLRDVATLEDIEGYLFRTAFNLVRSQWRRAATEARTVGRCWPMEVDGHQQRVDHDLVIDLWHTVQSLPQRQRETVVRRFYLGASVSDTASAMGCSPGTVKATTSHALRSLRRSVARP
jgi:RNA polymerase sigma factor (sigma-70 family)